MHLRPDRALIMGVSCLLACAAIGCGHKPATLTLHPAGRDIAFAQSFAHAYSAQTDDGTREFVLLADEAPAAEPRGNRAEVSSASSSNAGGKPINASAAAPLRQVVHIKLLWQPLSGVRETAGTNASIHWYVLSSAADGSDDLLVYKGAGAVTVGGKDNHPRVTIRRADLKPVAARGSLSDPIGPTVLRGSFVATPDNERLREVMKSTRARSASVATSK